MHPVLDLEFCGVILKAKWQKDVTIIGKMATLQKKMIEHALKNIKVGGELIYSVCSFENEERNNRTRSLVDERV